MLSETVDWRCSVKKVFLKISQNSQENPCTLRPATLSKKRLWRRCFPVSFAKFVRTLFHRKPPMAASLLCSGRKKDFHLFHLKTMISTSINGSFPIIIPKDRECKLKVH